MQKIQPAEWASCNVGAASRKATFAPPRVKSLPSLLYLTLKYEESGCAAS